MGIRGIYGKGIAAGNLNYTTGLVRKSMQKWTFENLDSFLKAPKEFAGDTAMGAVAVKSAKDRRDLIEFLKAWPIKRFKESLLNFQGMPKMLLKLINLSSTKWNISSSKDGKMSSINNFIEN